MLTGIHIKTQFCINVYEGSFFDTPNNTKFTLYIIYII